MYNTLEEAVRLVVKAFDGKKRAKEDIGLSFHSITVGFMLMDAGCDEETVLSGLLHDIIEDTSYNYDYLVEHFGKDVADNVLAISEDMSISDWKERKIAFIKNLATKSEKVIMVEVADKLHNLLSDYELWKIKGNDGLASIHATFEMNRWYYLEMKRLFNEKLKSNCLLDRYNNICKIYFNG